MADLLDDDRIATALAELEGWRREGDELVLDRKMKDFAAAMAYINAVAERAEAANHHPDLRVHGWNNVELRLSTHSAGGITEADVNLARELSALVPGTNVPG